MPLQSERECCPAKRRWVHRITACVLLPARIENSLQWLSRWIVLQQRSVRRQVTTLDYCNKPNLFYVSKLHYVPVRNWQRKLFSVITKGFFEHCHFQFANMTRLCQSYEIRFCQILNVLFLWMKETVKMLANVYMWSFLINESISKTWNKHY